MNKDIRCKYCNWLNKETLFPFKCKSCGRLNSEIEEYIPNNLDSWILEISKIKGIGKENIADIERIYKSEVELKNALDINNVPLRNDVVKKLKIYFNETK